MSTDSLRQTATTPFETGIVARLSVHLRQFVCGMHGHDSLLNFEHGRMSLLCSSCGYESPGWDVKATHQSDETAQTKPRVMRMPLVRARRVA
jgi:hypothetical protein